MSRRGRKVEATPFSAMPAVPYRLRHRDWRASFWHHHAAAPQEGLPAGSLGADCGQKNGAPAGITAETETKGVRSLTSTNRLQKAQRHRDSEKNPGAWAWTFSVPLCLCG